MPVSSARDDLAPASRNSTVHGYCQTGKSSRPPTSVVNALATSRKLAPFFRGVPPAIPHKRTAPPIFDLAGVGTLVHALGRSLGRAIQQFGRRITQIA